MYGWRWKKFIIYIYMLQQPAASLSEDMETMFIQPTNEGKTMAEHPIGPHFLQQFLNCPKLCTCVTFPVQRPKLVVGAHGKDMLEVVASQVLFSPSVRQVDLQCSLSVSLRLVMLKRQPW